MKILIVLFCLSLLYACEKDHGSPTQLDFPDTVGDHWVYSYRDGSNQEQTIDVEITGAGMLPNGQNATIWTAKLNGSLISTQYVVINNGAAIFYNAPCRTCTQKMPDERKRYIFPLQVGNKWSTPVVWGDTTKVLSQGTITVPAGAFENTFEMSKMVGYIVNTYTIDTIWFTPKVGMIKLYQREYSLGPIPGNGIWDLQSFSLK